MDASLESNQYRTVRSVHRENMLNLVILANDAGSEGGRKAKS